MLSSLHDKHDVVHAERASNNNGFACKKKYSCGCLLKKLEIDKNSCNPTYKITRFHTVLG